MKTVFLCSIGPVQEFIVNARRSRDLWYGSWMLSELAKSVSKKIDCIGGDLIFPKPVKPNDLDENSAFNCPNRVSAVFADFNESIAKSIKHSARNRLMELWNESLVHIEDQAKLQNVRQENLFTNPILPKKQIKDLLEFYWVAVPYEEGDYPKARDRAEALLAARKNTRDFKLKDGEETPKSSLDGIRESVIPESYYGNSSNQVRLLYKVYRARGAERLSGVDLLKRLGRLGDEPKFASTSDVAAAPLMNTLSEAEQKKLIDYLKEMLTNEGVLSEEISENASLIFENRFKEYLWESAGQKKILKKHHDHIKAVFNGADPYPYYSLFIADGDNMGKLINQLGTIDSHSLHSQKLSKFAENLPQIINVQYEGTCIYTGGEDILAYLPLHKALEFASFIDKDFSSSIKTTLSGGLVIAHHLAPLNEVMRLAREAEKKSKMTASKNALTVVLSKRSGTETEITDNWQQLTDRLLLLKGWLKADLLGQGVGYELKNLAEDFKGFDLRTNEAHRDAIAKEAVRIINRKRHSDTNKPLDTRLKQRLEDWIVTDKIPVAQIADEIIVASEFTN